MAFINHEGISFSIKGWDGKKYIQVTHHISSENALFEKVDASTALLKAFHTVEGTYFFKADYHSESAAADNIRRLARKAAEVHARQMADVSGETDLSAGSDGGIIDIIRGLGTTTIREYLGHTEGYYKRGNLYYPDKVLFDLL